MEGSWVDMVPEENLLMLDLTLVTVEVELGN